MIKILAIGNSFSQDATTYLHDMALCGGVETKVVNLYIGGCSLSTHWENAERNMSDYEYQLNGMVTGRKVSIRDALLEDTWDFITLQQSSPLCGILQSYYPYITRLSEYVTSYVPSGKQLVHQTWAYETDCGRDAFSAYRRNQRVMYKALRLAYKKAAKGLRLPLIPSGEAIQKLRKCKPFDYEKGGLSLCRDGFHLGYVYGRFAAAAVWYETILKGTMLTNDFLPRDPEGKEKADADLLELIRRVVHKVCR